MSQRDRIVAHLVALQQHIQALILEFTDEPVQEAPRCCSSPEIEEVELSEGIERHCKHCDAWLGIKAGSDKVRGQHQQS